MRYCANTGLFGSIEICVECIMPTKGNWYWIVWISSYVWCHVCYFQGLRFCCCKKPNGGSCQIIEDIQVGVNPGTIQERLKYSQQR